MKRILFVLLLTLFPMAIQVSAQGAPGLESLIVDFWPEYDQPNMLVIYRAVLSPTVSLPAEIIFRIPVEAGSPHAVAVGPSPELVADVVATTSVAGEWIEVSFIATTPALRLEYYDPRLEKEGALRRFRYDWPGDYAVGTFTMNVQHPVGASNVRVTPAAGRVVPFEDGFTYNVIELGSIGSGERFSLELQYDKETDALSVEALQVQPSAPISPGAGSGIRINQIIPWALGILGVVLIAGGGIWYWRSGRGAPASANRRPRRASRSSPGSAGMDEAIYCHQCGKRAEPGDRYCRSCGTRLRTV